MRADDYMPVGGREAFVNFADAFMRQVIVAARQDVARRYFGESIGPDLVDWFRLRARHPEMRLAGPVGRLP